MNRREVSGATTRDPGGRPRLLVAQTALTRATDAATAAGPTESGGVLIGFRADQDVYVTDAVIVPAESAAGTRYVSTAAERDAAVAQFQRRHPDPRIGYVGTWHSHPGAARASPTDKRTLRSEATEAPDLVAMLVLMNSRRGWQTDAYIGHHHRLYEYRRARRILRRDPWVTPASVVLVDS